MCGIAGIYSFKNNITAQIPYISRCIKTMQHRGPDAEGIWHNNENYITAFVRLAIRDLSEHGNQPMHSQCGNYCITFNGEIYNSDKFISPLKKKGVEFRSSSDTEVLLYSIIHFGIRYVLDEFDGMFAFAFYDKQKDELILARDRLGIKPLYVGLDTANHLVYSSQYDHVINFETFKNEGFDYNAIGTCLQLGFMPDNAGVVSKTFLFPHGYYAIVNPRGFQKYLYYIYHANDKIQSGAAISEEVFNSSVQRQLVSDVPVGTYLSGGVDSSLITLWCNQTQNITAFTIGTDDEATNEKDDAMFFANEHNIPHQVSTITEADLFHVVKDNFEAYTEPFADFSSLPTLLLSKHASQFVKVILSGDGPDELFWGYNRNVKAMQTGKKFFEPKLLLLAEAAFSKISGTKQHVNKRMVESSSFALFYYKSLFTFGGEAWIDKIYAPKCSNAFFLEQLQQWTKYDDESCTYMNIVRELEMNIHLQRILLKVDRASMYYSLEARVPYLGNDVLDASLFLSANDCIHDNIGKYNLKNILAEKTKEQYAFRQKRGFLVPMKDWLRKSLRKDVEEKLMNMPAELSSAFNKNQLQKLLHQHMTEEKDFSGIIWALYALVNWNHIHRNKYKN